MPSIPIAKLIPRFLIHGMLYDNDSVLSAINKTTAYTVIPRISNELINAIILTGIFPGRKSNSAASNGRIIKDKVSIRSPGLT